MAHRCTIAPGNVLFCPRPARRFSCGAAVLSLRCSQQGTAHEHIPKSLNATLGSYLVAETRGILCFLKGQEAASQPRLIWHFSRQADCTQHSRRRWVSGCIRKFHTITRDLFVIYVRNHSRQSGWQVRDCFCNSRSARLSGLATVPRLLAFSAPLL